MIGGLLLRDWPGGDGDRIREWARRFEPSVDISYACQDLCGIYSNTLLNNDEIRRMIRNHAFHATCVDCWLLQHRGNCPGWQRSSFNIVLYGDITRRLDIVAMDR